MSTSKRISRSEAAGIRNANNSETNKLVSISPKSVVCPGILSKDINKKWTALSSVKIQQRESLKSNRLSTAFSIGKIDTIASTENTLYLSSHQGSFEIHIKEVSLSDTGAQRITQVFKSDIPNIQISWKFLTFDKTDIVLLSEKNFGSYIVESSVIYKININTNLLDYFSTQNIYIELFTWTSKQEKYLARGELKLCDALDYPCSNIDALIELCDADKALLLSNTGIAVVYGTLSLWYRFNCDIDILNRVARTYYNTLSTVSSLKQHKSSLVTCYRAADSRQFSVISKKNSLSINFYDDEQTDDNESLDSLEPTESEITNFKEALDLVLIRNKALRTTQSEISNELHDRARWLHEESNWKRTLQEYSILSGKDPTLIEWRQWRNQSTTDISLRNYPSQMIIYDPEVSINVKYVRFHKDSQLIKSNKFKKFYVEYTFLSHEGLEMESPSSDSDGSDGKKLYFNFKKQFCIDPIQNEKDANMLSNAVKNSEYIKFTVVGEPANDPANIPCAEEVTFCLINMLELLQLESNEFSEILPLKDPGNDKVRLGVMKIDISGVLAMRRLALQILAPPEYNILQ